MAADLSQPLTDIKDEAHRILRFAEANKIVLKLIGGMAVKLLSTSSREGPLSRPYPNDLDFAGYSSQSTAIKKLFTDLGYAPNKRFNALHGRTRLQFTDVRNDRTFDVFLDVFKMCHQLPLKERLKVEGPTLAPADLLLTKLQIVRLNEKDVKDLLAIITDNQLGTTDNPSTLNVTYIASLCAKEWGLYKTVTTNLSHLQTTLDQYMWDVGRKEAITQKISSIIQVIENQPKTIKWALRAKIGEKMPWYDLPEAAVREIGERYEVQANQQ